jgi:hypothetical protein
MRNIDALSDDAVSRLSRSVAFGFDAAAVALALASADDLDQEPAIRARLVRIKELEARILSVLSARVLSPGSPDAPRETRRP